MNAHHVTTPFHRPSGSLTARTVMVAVLLVAGLAGVGLAGPAGAADSTQYGFTATSRAIETYAQIPSEQGQGSPSGVVYLEKPDNPFCEGIAGGYDLGVIFDDFFEITIPNYKNPTRVRVHNPEDSFKTKKEFNTFPGGPSASADCATPESGVSRATWGGGGNDQGSVNSAFAESKAARTPGKAEVVTEQIARLKGVKLGNAGFSLIESWMKVTWDAGAEPVIAYRLNLGGFFNGTDAVGAVGEPGLTIAGQARGGAEFIKQFNDQSKAHEGQFATFGKYGFEIVQPKYFTDPLQGQPTIQMACVDGSLGFAPRKGGIGENQGIRFGLTRVQGLIRDL
jgi:hypothetical protein